MIIQLTVLLVNIVMCAFYKKRPIGALQLSYGKLLSRWNIVQSHVHRRLRAVDPNVAHRPLLVKRQGSLFRGLVEGFFELKAHVLRAKSHKVDNITS